MTGFDQYFLDIARHVSTRSKDRSTKVGCVIVGPDNEIRSTGYNSFPRKLYVRISVDGRDLHDQFENIEVVNPCSGCNLSPSDKRKDSASKQSSSFLSC